MPTFEQELKKIAALAYIEADNATMQQLAHDVNAIMDFVANLCQVDTTGQKPLLHPLDIQQRLRPDEVLEKDCTAQLATTAPLFGKQLYLVPKVIETGK